MKIIFFLFLIRQCSINWIIILWVVFKFSIFGFYQFIILWVVFKFLKIIFFLFLIRQCSIIWIIILWKLQYSNIPIFQFSSFPFYELSLKFENYIFLFLIRQCSFNWIIILWVVFKFLKILSFPFIDIFNNWEILQVDC